MEVNSFVKILGADFYSGVPDSHLRALCDYLMNTYGIDPQHHVIAVNEGNSVALAAGYHLASGKTAVVYMQNSGEGNSINPIASLLNDNVYGIPVIFVIGWRGEPGVHDEPQHIFQGQITLKLLNDMDIKNFVVGKETTEDELATVMDDFQSSLMQGKAVAFVIKKGALVYEDSVIYNNNNAMRREDIIQHIVEVSGSDPIISTTGKASRELFEIRERKQQSHASDFLTVGSMGHSSSIALGIAVNRPKVKIWCIDGDGAMLMHMGAMALIGSINPVNLVHIVINNVAHESVGGAPTIAGNIDIIGIAKACGYPSVVRVDNFDDLDRELQRAQRRNALSFIEIKCSIGARENLGRPTIPAKTNKLDFMRYLQQKGS